MTQGREVSMPLGMYSDDFPGDLPYLSSFARDGPDMDLLVYLVGEVGTEGRLIDMAE
jgi:hypothetical protein